MTTDCGQLDVSLKFPALSSAESVCEISSILMRLSERIHHSLRRLSCHIVNGDSTIAYGLLTEEYSLRSRARNLMTEPDRFVIGDLCIEQQVMVGQLNKIENKLEGVESLDALSKLIIASTLFANSISSKEPRIISYIFHELVILS